MGYTVTFLDNQQVTAADLNALAEDVGAPASDTAFTNNVTYGVDALNGITKDVIGAGVSRGDGNECRVVVQTGGVKILSGLIFFASGAKLRIDSDGVILPVISGTACYVYAQHDAAANTIACKCSAALPGGDCVLLAEVGKTGAVTDRRSWALMKNASLLPNQYVVTQIPSILVYQYGQPTVWHDTGLDVTGYRYAYLQYMPSGGSSWSFGMLDLQTGTLYGALYGGGGSSSYVDVGELRYGNYGVSVVFQVKNGHLWVQAYRTIGGGNQISFGCNVILM